MKARLYYDVRYSTDEYDEKLKLMAPRSVDKIDRECVVPPAANRPLSQGVGTSTVTRGKGVGCGSTGREPSCLAGRRHEYPL